MNDARVSSDEVLIKYYRFNSVLPRIGGMREICERACLTAFSINRWTRYLTSTLIRHLVKYEWKLSQPPLQALKGVVGRLNLRRSTPLLSLVKCDAFRTIEGGGGGGMVRGRNERRKLLTSRTIPSSIFIVTIFYWIGSRVYVCECVRVRRKRDKTETNEG